MKHVTIITDGSCLGNPGPGGWAALLVYTDARGHRHERVLCGGHPATTNNRMELQAALQALQALTEPCQITPITDSQYLQTMATGGQARANHDLVAELRQLLAQHQITVQHVYGHAGHPEHTRVDALARAEATRVTAHRHRPSHTSP